MTATTRRPTTPDAPDWRAQAACASVDAELFFPTAHTNGWRKQTRDAKTICNTICPVREACLEWALDTAQPAGVWGGMSERERRALRGMPESQMQRCLDRQVWIEQQLAAGVSQRDIAPRLRVTRATLSRAVNQFQAERAAQGVKAA